jgi:hypothetical protein
MYVLWSNLNPNPNNLQTLLFLAHSYYYSSILSPDYQVLRFVSLKAELQREEKFSVQKICWSCIEAQHVRTAKQLKP